MSGAEAIVAFGIASNVIQFIDFTVKLCSQIQAYASGSGLPKNLATQADRLQDLLDILKSLSKSSNQGVLSGQTLARCQTQAQELSDFLDDLKTDGQRQSWAKNARKAFKSLNRSDQIEELQGVLDSLVGTLSLQLQADTRSTSSQVQANTVSILERQLEQTSLLSDLRHMAGLKNQVNDNASFLDKVLWMVSIGRNPDFVGRIAVMSALESKLATKADAVPAAVLCGLGGVGKSQIALEYAYRERGRSANTSVFWVHAGNAARFIESYKRIASECQIPGRDDPNADVLQLVRDWLEAKYECRWLMVVDNVDDRNMFFETLTFAGKALREYIPQSSKGSLLYTTRNRDIGMDLALDRVPITVPSMDAQEAQALLGQRIRAESTETEQLELLEELVYLPLAISQAVAFMVKRHKSVAEYVKLYRGSESTRVRLLGQRFNYHGREIRPLESVVTTWWISFNYIKMENPRAAEILSVMSFLDQQGIPFSLLIADEEDEFEFEEAMGLLEAFSLVTLDTHRYACNVHGLVTVAVRGWLSEYENKRDIIATRALQTVSDRFPDGFFESWPTCRIYFRHAEEVLRSSAVLVQDTSLHAKASLLLNMSTFLRMQGRYEASELRAVESMQVFERLYGSEHPDTLSATASYARTIHRRGRYRDGMLLQRQILKSREKVFGIGHRTTLESLNALGSDLQDLGQYREAEEVHRRELVEKQKYLDEQPEDVGIQADIIIAMNNVARVLSHQRRFAEAEQLHREALDKGQLVLGHFHPDMFITRGELAGTVRDQDRLDEAEQMYSALLKDRLDWLGDRHPDTLITVSHLATVYARQGNHRKAEDTYREALRVEREILGVTHPSTVTLMHGLACSAFNREDYLQAAIEFEAVLKLQNKVIGLTHPHTMVTRRNLAVALRKFGDFEQGDKLDNETLDMSTGLDENKEAERLQTLDNLAKGFQDRERYEDAERFRRQELELRLASGEDEEGIQDSLNSLAFLLGQQGKHDESEPIYKQILDYRTMHYGPEHGETLQTLWNLALVYREQKDFVNAESKYVQLVGIQSKTVGADHPKTLDSLMQLGWVLQQQQKYAQSEERYRFLLEARRKSLGPEHPITLMIMNNLASVLKYQDNESEEATPLLRHVYETRSRILGPDGDPTKHSMWFLADHLRDLGQHDEAEILYRQKIELDENVDDSDSVPSPQQEQLPASPAPVSNAAPMAPNGLGDGDVE